jgi:hypothetical protein
MPKYFKASNGFLLGYDLYGSALADILTEPSLSMPITVGLYAKWGSGKSFLLKKLRQFFCFFSLCLERREHIYRSTQNSKHKKGFFLVFLLSVEALLLIWHI